MIRVTAESKVVEEVKSPEEIKPLEESDALKVYIKELNDALNTQYFIPLVRNYYQESGGKILYLRKAHTLGDYFASSYGNCLYNAAFRVSGSYSTLRYFDFTTKIEYSYSFFFKQLETNCGIAFFFGLSFYNKYYNPILTFIEQYARDLGFSQLIFTHALTKEQCKIATDFGFKLVHSTRNRRSGSTIQTFVKDIHK